MLKQFNIVALTESFGWEVRYQYTQINEAQLQQLPDIILRLDFITTIMIPFYICFTTNSDTILISSKGKVDSFVNERRTLERIRCYYYLKVYNKDNNQDIGSVIDISRKGMRLISEIPFTADSHYHLTIKLPKGYIHGYSFDIDAEARWCEKKEDDDYYEAGFKFINAKKSGIVFIKMLIDDFKSNDLL